MKTQYLQRMLIGLGLAMALIAPWASATNYYVVASSQQPSPTPPWTNWGWAHTNLVEVVAAARDNDIVYVTNNAKYYLTNQITVSYAITVRSWGPGGIYDPINTILDGNYPTTTNRHFTLNNYGATVAGFTLTNGWGSEKTNILGNAGANGGSIFLYYGMVTNCIIMRNYALNTNASSDSGGGGIFFGNDSAKSGSVWNCTISANSSRQYGGGINMKVGKWRIVNCTISGNSTGIEGGGLYASPNQPSVVISNCCVVSNLSGCSAGGIKMNNYTECYNSVIMGNTANNDCGGGIRMGGACVLRNCLIADNLHTVGGGGGGIDAAGSGSLIQNCTIVSNRTVQSGGGITLGIWYAASLTIENTIIWGNREGADGSGASSNLYIGQGPNTFTNCCTSPRIVSAYATEVNTITNDPRFVSVTAADFRLQSDSPCINAGVNRDWMEGGWDAYGNRRIDNFRRTVDIGAYEYLSKGTVFGFQ
ncbi:MAG: hypothetical protein NT011_10685 [Kiritimatiellaeota bacterium]|nr:hypothetical protein [Kiritimatiellota bacterium]